jgi:hypothetical protein
VEIMNYFRVLTFCITGNFNDQNQLKLAGFSARIVFDPECGLGGLVFGKRFH